MTTNRGDETRPLIKKLIKRAHFLISLSLIIIAIFTAYLSSWVGTETLIGTMLLSLTTALVTAAIVDFMYKYLLMKDVEEMNAKQLMLRRDVQDEILKKEKVNEIFHVALGNMLGEKLAAPFEKVINEIAPNKDLYLMERAEYIIILKNSTDPLLRDFFEVEKISKFTMVLEEDKAVFYATDSDKLFENLYTSDPSTYLSINLPEDTGKMLNKYKKEPKTYDTLVDKFLSIQELSIDGESIAENSVRRIGDNNEDETVIITIAFNIPKNIFKNKHGKVVRVRFKLQSLIGKCEHYALRSIPRAYPRHDMLWDCSETDIEHVTVCYSYLGSTPDIEKLSPDGKMIKISVHDWVLPNSLVVFIWRLKGEKRVEENEGDMLFKAISLNRDNW